MGEACKSADLLERRACEMPVQSSNPLPVGQASQASQPALSSEASKHPGIESRSIESSSKGYYRGSRETLKAPDRRAQAGTGRIGMVQKCLPNLLKFNEIQWKSIEIQ